MDVLLSRHGQVIITANEVTIMESSLKMTFLKVKVIFYVLCKISSFSIKREMAAIMKKVLLAWISQIRMRTCAQLYTCTYTQMYAHGSQTLTFCLFAWSALDESKEHLLWVLNLRRDKNSSLAQMAKNLPAVQETQVRSVSRRSLGEGNGNPLQYFCLENPTDRVTWWATSMEGNKELDTTKWLTHTHTHTHTHTNSSIKIRIGNTAVPRHF